MIGGCPECGAPLAQDQRYCIACGARLEDIPRTPEAEPPAEPHAGHERRWRGPTLMIRVRGRAGIVRLPDKRSTVALTAGVLGVGVLMGVAVGPVAAGSSLPSARQIIAVVTGQPQVKSAAPAPAVSSGSSSGLSAETSASSSAPADTSASSTAAPSAATGSAASTGTDTTATTDTSTTPTDTTTTPTDTTTTTTPAAITPKPPKLTLTGVVAAVDGAAQGFALVDRRGRLFAIHAATTPKVGKLVKVSQRTLANGTIEAVRVVETKTARATKLTLEGVVTFVDPTNKRYALSSHGASMLVAASAQPTATPASVAPPASLLDSVISALTGKAPTAKPADSASGPGPVPALGHRVKVVLAIPPATAAAATPTTIGLAELARTDRGAAKPPLELAGVISAIDTTARKLAITADGAGTTNGGTVILAVPASIDLKKLATGLAVVAHATVAADGTYTLTGLASDSGATAADDAANAFGDFKRAPRASRRAAATRRSSPARR
jgi:hypothetical protein